MLKLKTQNSKLKTRRRGARCCGTVYDYGGGGHFAGHSVRADMAAAGAQNYALHSGRLHRLGRPEHARADTGNPNDPNTRTTPIIRHLTRLMTMEFITITFQLVNPINWRIPIAGDRQH